jgi:hypothetical protein
MTKCPTLEDIESHRGSAVAVADRRDFPRYPIPNRLGVELRVLPSTDVIPGEIQDLSREGVGLVTQVFIAPGESVTFPVGDDWVVAEVRHCDEGEDGYVVGAFITDIVGKRQIEDSK